MSLGLDGDVPDHSTFSKNRHGRFRESDLLRKLFETVVAVGEGSGWSEGEAFAVDASVVVADAHRRRGVAKVEDLRRPRSTSTPRRSGEWRTRSSRTCSLNSRRLVGEAEEQQRPYLEAKHGEAGIDSEPIAERLLPAGVAILLGPPQTFQRFAVLSHKDLHRAEQAVADEPVGRVVLPVRDFDDLARQGERGLYPPRHQVADAKAKEHGEALHIGPNAGVEKPLRRGQGRDRFRRGYSPSTAKARWRGRPAAPVREIGGPAHPSGAGSARGQLRYGGSASAVAERDSASSAAVSQ